MELMDKMRNTIYSENLKVTRGTMIRVEADEMVWTRDKKQKGKKRQKKRRQIK